VSQVSPDRSPRVSRVSRVDRWATQVDSRAGPWGSLEGLVQASLGSPGSPDSLAGRWVSPVDRWVSRGSPDRSPRVSRVDRWDSPGSLVSRAVRWDSQVDREQASLASQGR
jgi:hypothetical protein